MQEQEEEKISQNYIHKKLAANEVYKVLKSSKTLAFISIAGIFIVQLVSRFNYWGGLMAALILIVALAIFLYKDNQQMQLLNQKYNLETIPIKPI